MWKLKTSPKTVRVTKKLASEFAEMDAALTDRALSERRLTVYRKMIREGGFRPVSWAKAYCEETGQYYRVNGKHTSTLFSSLPSEEMDGLFAIVEDYHCDTLSDVAQLYATFDSQQQTRSASDINRAFSVMIPELKDMAPQIINLLVSGLTLSTNPDAQSLSNVVTHRTQAERAELLFDNVQECLWITSILGETRNNANGHLWRVPIVAAMIGCYGKSQRAATDFWLAVRDETGISPDLPDRKLAKFLTTMKSNIGNESGVPKRFRVNQREFYVKAVHAWNAWRKGDNTNLKYHADSKVPAIA